MVEPVTPPPVVTPPTPVIPPDGSISSDWAYPLGVSLLSQLSESTKSDLLAVTNIGSSIANVIEKALERINKLSEFTTFLLDGTQLDSLANGGSVNYTVSNTGDSPAVRLIIILGAITPTFRATIEVSDGVTAYQLSLSAANSVKRIEFNDLDPSFLILLQLRIIAEFP